jgi:acyl-CoA synthetase (AMP-forming)/AMP-acid ligase II
MMTLVGTQALICAWIIENILCFYVRRDHNYKFIDDGEVTLGLMPLFHAYGFMFQLLLITAGAKVVLMDRFEEHTFLRSIQNHKVRIQ